MKQSHQQNKYSIAWFKIADFVSRGEKERALGVYRLLSHSFEDRALVLQLEADILLSCNDDRAIEKYEQSALLYQQAGRLYEAVGVYEHIMTIQQEFSCKILVALIVLYGLLSDDHSAHDRTVLLINQFLAKNSVHLLQEYINPQSYTAACVDIFFHATVQCMEQICLDEQQQYDVIRALLNCCQYSEYQNTVQTLLKLLEAHHNWYEFALECIKKQRQALGLEC